MNELPTQLATKVLTNPAFTDSVVYRNAHRRITIERNFGSNNKRAIVVKSISEKNSPKEFLYFHRSELSPSFNMARMATGTGRVLPELEDAIDAVAALTWSAMMEGAGVVDPKWEQELPGPLAEEICKRALKMETVVRKAHNGLWVRPFTDACVRCWERDKAIRRLTESANSASCPACLTTYLPDQAALPPEEKDKGFVRSALYQPIPLVTCQCPSCNKPGYIVETLNNGVVRIKCEDDVCDSLYEAEIPPPFSTLKDRVATKVPNADQRVMNRDGEYVTAVGAVIRTHKLTDAEREALDLIDSFLFEFIPSPGGRWNVVTGYARHVKQAKIIRTRDEEVRSFIQDQPGWRAYQGEPGNWRFVE